MDARKCLSEYGANLSFDPKEVRIDDDDVFKRLSEPVQKWWSSEFGRYVGQNDGFFTPPQKEAIPHIEDGRNTLVASPTGSGKTLSSFTTQIDRLFDRAREGELENSVYCLYVSPLKSLANDIKKNLSKPLEGIKDFTGDDTQEIRHAIRHGDTPSKERQKMLDETPHILNTTPETLAILLNSPKFREKLKTVETVIVDEIHSLAENKRGVHLSLSLERLEKLTPQNMVRVGCSATVEPLDGIAQFLVGRDVENNRPRDYEIVDTRFVRDTDLSVHTPVDDLINSSSERISKEFYDSLHKEIQDHNTTLVFTNTRSGSENTLASLRRNYEEYYDDTNSAVHHGSLSKQERKRVEDGLKDGSMDVVTTSTSLELGIDMGSVDLVAQVGSPKSIASLLQRIGRAGHQLGETVEGRLFVLDRDELVECTTMAKKADEGFIDRVFVPENCRDVATQHVYGIAINNIRTENEVFDIIRSAYPYRNYTRDMFHNLLRYMSADYEGVKKDESEIEDGESEYTKLEDRNVYAKIWWDENDPEDGEYHYEEFDVGEKLIGKRGSQARVIYYTNIGTIPDSFSCDVFVRGEDSWVGQLDEEYLDTLDKGDVFQLGGKNYEYRYRRGSKVYTDRTGKAPTVPSWFSERLPLSYDLGVEVLRFQDEMTERMENHTVDNWLDSFPVDENTKKALKRLYENQTRFMGDNAVSLEDRYIVEEHKDDDLKKTNYYFQSCYGRKFNDGMSRLVAQYFAQRKNINVEVAVEDQGFAIKVPSNIELDIVSALKDIETDEVESMMRDSVEGTDFLKRYFRINAGRSLLILRNYKGRSKSAKQQQVRSEMLLGFVDELENFAVLEETYREILEDKLDVDKIIEFLNKVQDGEVTVTQRNVPTPSPRSFKTAALASEDVVMAGDESKALENFHEQVIEEIQD
jgi:ATP-dependent Lhr-like helicase